MQSLAYPYLLKTNDKTFPLAKYNESEFRLIDIPADVQVLALKRQKTA